MCNTEMLNKTTYGRESTLPKISFKILVKMDLVILCITEQKKTEESLKSKKRYLNAKAQNMLLNFCANLSSIKFFRT